MVFVGELLKIVIIALAVFMVLGSISLITKLDSEVKELKVAMEKLEYEFRKQGGRITVLEINEERRKDKV